MRVVEPVKEHKLAGDILESPDLEGAERRSAWW